MSNSRTTAINYKPRMTELEAYDALPLALKRALQVGPQQWDSYFIYREYKRQLKTWAETRAVNTVIKMIEDWHSEEVQEGYPWRSRKVGQRWADVPLSPHVIAGAKML